MPQVGTQRCSDEGIYPALVEGRLTDEQRRQLLLPYQALHAASVEFQWRGREWTFSCEPEEWSAEFTGERPGDTDQR